MDLVIKIEKRLPKGSHKGRQSGHNRATGKYVKQRFRTTQNKINARKKHLANNPNDLQAIANLT